MSNHRCGVAGRTDAFGKEGGIGFIIPQRVMPQSCKKQKGGTGHSEDGGSKPPIL